MSESADYTPAPHWGGYDFATARRAYADNVVARGSVTPASIGLDPSSLVPEALKSEAEAPFVLVTDVTGSMGEWPTAIFSKLPYLEHEGKDYLGEDMEICFAAIGDHTQGDKYPLQVRPFVKGTGLKEALEKLIHEKGGGGDSEESYELAACYFAENCETPNAVRKPLMIFIGDEGIHSVLTADDATRWCKASVKRATPKELFARLRQKFEVYIIRKPYNCDAQNSSPANDKIQNQWEELLGADHVVSLPEPQRVVDVIFGILGEFTGRYDDFVKELRERQGKDKDGDHKINVVLKSLRSLHEKKSLKKLPPPARAKSITRKSVSKGSTPSKKGSSGGAINLRDEDD
jgi:hypothetical protein